MKVLFACEYFLPFAPGGAEWSTLQLAEELVHRGHSVEIVTPNYGAERHEEINGVKVYRFPFFKKLPKGQKSVSPLWTTNIFFYLFFALFILSRVIQRKTDVIHAQNTNALLPAFIAGKTTGKPVSFTIRDTGVICPIGALCLLKGDVVPHDCGLKKLEMNCSEFYYEFYIKNGEFKKILIKLLLPLRYFDIKLKQVILSRISGIIGVSNGILKVYQNAGILKEGVGEVVYNIPPQMVKVKDKAIDNKSKTVLYVGKLSLGKGIHIFVEAAEIISKRFKGVKYIVAGKGEYDHKTKIANIQFLGSIPHDEVMKLYETADVVVLPSIWPEPFSRVPLEAAAFEVPTIGTRSGGTEEMIVQGETGLLIDKNNPQELADAIIKLLADDDLRISMGKKAKRYIAKKFYSEKTIDDLIKLYSLTKQ